MNNIKIHKQFIDLAPSITRRRLVIECIHNNTFNKDIIYNYMVNLSSVMNMSIVSMPTFNYEKEYGLSSYMCWKESGMHVYTWNKTSTRPNFMSIDIYTCKDFDINEVINYTTIYFKNNITEITWRE